MHTTYIHYQTQVQVVQLSVSVTANQTPQLHYSDTLTGPCYVDAPPTLKLTSAPSPLARAS